MASTYSDLKIQLMATGENSGTWGNVTNVNLGTAIEEAIVGSADVAFSSADVTLTLTDTNETQAARNLRLNLTGTSGGARNLEVPAIEKVYIINNGLADAVTVKNSTGTGVAVPAGKTMYVYNDGTNVVDAVTHLSSLSTASLVATTADINGGTIDGAAIGSSSTSTGAFSNLSYTGTLTGSTGVLNIGSGQIYKDASGNVGIGKTPTAKLHISGFTNIGGIFVEDSSSSDASPAVVVTGKRSDGNGSQSFSGKLLLSKNQTNAAIDSSGDALGTIMFGGNHTDGSLSNILYPASISGISEGAFSNSTTMPTGIAFYTGSTGRDGDTANVSSGSERMRIDSSGNVGIGVSDLSPLGAVNSPSFGIFSSGGSRLGIWGNAGRWWYLEAESSDAFRIGFRSASNTVDNNAVTITTNGNVGIGTSSPNTKLYVSGPDGVLARFKGSTGPSLKIESYGSNNEVVSESGTLLLGTLNGNTQFYTGTGTAVERMRIDSSGNVGIGTSSPRSELEIAATTSPTLTFGRTGSADGNGVIQSLGNTGTVNAKITLGSGSDKIINFEVNGSPRARIDSSGNFLVGTTSTSYAYANASFRWVGFVSLSRDTTANTNQIAFFNPNGLVGAINTSGSATLYITSSDYRLKEDVQPMSGNIDRLMALKPVNFAWKVDGTRVDGFLAHEAQEVVPEAVTGTKDAVDEEGNPEYQGIDQAKIVPLLTAALQDAIKRIETLEAQLKGA